MGKRILVIDDEAVVLEAVRRGLKGTDCIVDALDNPGEALTLFGKTAHDIVITDLMMPGMDGFQVLQRVHEMHTATRVIILTGYPTIQSASQAKRLGAFDYIIKPFTRQELLSVVLRALGHDS
jgi:DNA-binding NtrC family response regulator